MENGLTAQLMKSVTPIPRACCFTSCKAPKSTLSNIGTIMSQTKTATGKLTSASFS